MKQIITLVRKDFLLEWRQKHTFFGVLLYVSCTTFVIYMMTGQPESRTWNALYWIAMLFVTVNTVAKCFLQESEQKMRYYIALVKPSSYLLSKMIYSVILMLVISLLTLALFNLLLGSPVNNSFSFIVITCTGALSLSILFTFLSAIAAQARQNAALMAILGFPIAIPLLMILGRLTIGLVSAVQQQGYETLLFILLGMDILIVALGLILFPFIWKE